MAQDKKLDIIVFGASGFTGKHTISRLVELLNSEKLHLTWGIAGRSKKKLSDSLLELQETYGADYSAIPIIQADVDNIESLEDMTSQARIIMNAVGPYRYYGERVVQACVKTGTHHVDIACEMQFMESVQLKYHAVAQQKGIYLVSACGFESIPIDMGTVHLQKNFKGTLNSVETFLCINETVERFIPGALAHVGTYVSLLEIFAHRNELDDIRSKLHPRPLPELEPKLSRRCLIFWNASLGKWCTKYLTPDASVVSRTQRYFHETYNERPVQLRTYLCLRNFLQTFLIILLAAFTFAMAFFKITRRLLYRHPKFFTCGLISNNGPDPKEQENVSFKLILNGEGWSETVDASAKCNKPPDKRVTVTVSARNPGYGMTCTAFALAAITILTECEKLPSNGGCYTPGAAFANTSMIDKLNKHGVVFELDLCV